MTNILIYRTFYVFRIPGEASSVGIPPTDDEALSDLDDGSDSSSVTESTPTTDEGRHVFLRRIDEISQWAADMGLPVASDEVRLSSAANEAFTTHSTELGSAAAVTWAEGFQFDSDIAKRDEDRLRLHGFTLTGLARAMFPNSLEDRLNLDRVAYWREQDMVDPLHPDWTRLTTMASEGVRIEVDPNFKERTEPEPFRQSYKDVHQAVNKVMMSYWSNEFAFILSKETVEQLIRNGEKIHFSPVHWVTKHGAAQGRPIADVTAQSLQDVLRTGFWRALNSEHVKAHGIATYGPLTHPGMAEIVEAHVRNMDEHIRENLSGEALEWFKADLDKCFMRTINVHPDDVRLLAFQLTDGLVLFFRVGFFGYTSFPQICGVVTRTILRLLEGRIRGKVVGYVDDFFGEALRRHMAATQEAFRVVVTGLFGPAINNVDKEEAGAAIDALGWRLDNSRGRVSERSSQPCGTVSISRRNLLKALFHFTICPDDFRLSRTQIERLASYMMRYSDMVSAEWRPLAHILFRELKNLRRDSPKHVGPAAIMAIKIWRALFCAAAVDEHVLGRDFIDLAVAVRLPTRVLTFDGSLYGSGVRAAAWGGTAETGVEAGRTSVIWTSYESQGWNFVRTQDSSFQNTSEFMTIVIGVADLIRNSFRDGTVLLRGDSITALSWSTRRSFRSERCLRAALVLCHIQQRANIYIHKKFVFIAGDDNTLMDPVSRNAVPLDTWLDEDTQNVQAWIPSDPLTVGHESAWILELLALCDPESPLDSEPKWALFLAELNRWSDELFSQSPGRQVEAVDCDTSMDVFVDPIQVFVSASFHNIPEGAEGKRLPWTLTCERTTLVGEVCVAIARHYDTQPERIRFAISSSRIIVDWSMAERIVTLQPGEMIRLTAKLCGGAPKRQRDPIPTLLETGLDNKCVRPSILHTVGQGMILQGDLASLARIRPVESSTDATYAAAWRLWFTFLGARNQLQHVLLQHGSYTEKKTLLAVFAFWLQDVQRLSAARINQSLAGLRSMFIRLGEDSRLFSDDFIRATRRTLRLDAATSSRQRLQGIRRVPLPPVLLYDLWKVAVEAERISLSAGKHAWSILLAGSTMFNFGVRYSNVGSDVANGRHAIRRKDAVIQGTDGRRYSLPAFQAFLRDSGLLFSGENACLDHVEAVMLYFHSAKVHRIEGRVELARSDPNGPTQLRETFSNNQYVRQLARWMLFYSRLGHDGHQVAASEAGCAEDTPLFSRAVLVWSRHKRECDRVQRQSTAHLHRGTLVRALKLVGQNRGIDPRCLSTHSFKIGGITAMTAGGETQEAIRTFGDHAVGSASTFLYQRKTGHETRPLLLASRGRGLTVADVTRVQTLHEQVVSIHEPPEQDLLPIYNIEDRGDVCSDEDYDSDDSDSSATSENG